jgi:hypothetical protein
MQRNFFNRKNSRMNLHREVKCGLWLLLCCCPGASAQNPVSPMGVCLAAPAAHVMPEGVTQVRLRIVGEEDADWMRIDSFRFE